MFKLKRDWLIEIRSMTILWFSVMIGFLLIFIMTKNYPSENYWYFINEVIKSFNEVGTAIFASVPVFAFILVLPSGEKFNDGNGAVVTTMLPFSKKQLVWKGIKQWLIIYPLWIILSTVTWIIFKNKLGDYIVVDLILKSLRSTFYISFVIITIGMQMVGSIILSYSKNIRWYITTFVQIISNLMFFYGCMFVINRAGIDQAKDMTWLVIVQVVFFLISLIYFIYNLKDIEKVYI